VHPPQKKTMLFFTSRSSFTCHTKLTSGLELCLWSLKKIGQLYAKDQCIFVAIGLILALDRRFLAQELMNGTSIIYLKYWVQPEVALTFTKHLQNLKSHYYFYKMSQLDGKSYAPLHDHVLFEQQSNFFLMTMQSNNEVAMKSPHDYNPTT